MPRGVRRAVTAAAEYGVARAGIAAVRALDRDVVGQAHQPRGAAGRNSVDQLPPALDGPFDAIFAVNSHGFWPAPAQQLAELRRRLAPGGRIAIASQPAAPGPPRTRPAAPPAQSRTC